MAQEKCAVEEPQLVQISPGHTVACHYPMEPNLGAMLGTTADDAELPSFGP